ncbi:hypothetical protein D3C72_2148730 [compost metagenome]
MAVQEGGDTVGAGLVHHFQRGDRGREAALHLQVRVQAGKVAAALERIQHAGTEQRVRGTILEFRRAQAASQAGGRQRAGG